MFGLSRYQWLVLFAAWLGWGFDIFDGLLFNFVAPICIPYLLRLDAADPATKATTMYWTASLTSLLLVGWALGGVLFGKLTDRLGRTRTLLLTMLTYALGTAACALAPNIWVVALFRFVAALGIGGEWAAGASLVAETLPKERRVLGGALLYTSAPCGLLLATFVNDLFTRRLDSIAADPSLSWRAVFLTGLLPAAVALLLRLFVRESEEWSGDQEPPALRELFSGELARRTWGGLSLSIVALVAWWSLSAFIPVVSGYLAPDAVERTRYITIATTAFNLGGVLGTLLTVPLALRWGRRPMFALYFAWSALFIFVAFGLDLPALTRLYLLFPVGIGIFGIFGAFSFYLPELFPTRLRGTGAGFCYNAGRLVTAAFPFLVGMIVRSGASPLGVLSWVAIAPLVGLVLLLAGVGHETREA
ncbi:MAG TPA: MFS transporter [Polyangiaceae bacterium]|nr:MFS transporter [Polyangiaceae bacterium]